jgi:hypothetical protein
MRIGLVNTEIGVPSSFSKNDMRIHGEFPFLDLISNGCCDHTNTRECSGYRCQPLRCSQERQKDNVFLYWAEVLVKAWSRNMVRATYVELHDPVKA